MEALIRQASHLVGILGVLSLLTAPLLGGRRQVGVYVTLDLWTAAGLLRLGGELGWPEIAAAAAITAVRHLVSIRLRQRPGLRAMASLHRKFDV